MGNILTEFIVQGSAAFFGAFSAFLFVQIGNSLSRLHDRKIKHYDALVRLELELNHVSGVLADNIFVLEGLQKKLI